MNKTSILLIAALLFGAAILIQFIKPHDNITREFIDEVSEVLTTISTFAFMVGVMFF